MKRFASFLMLLVILATTLAACGGGSGGTTATDASPAASAAPAASPAETAASPAGEASPSAAASPAGEASPSAAASSAGEASPAATTEAAAELPNVSGIDLGNIKIASQSPLSGPQAALGTGIRNGAELGIEQYNERLGMNVEFAPFDDQATPDVGASNATQVAADQDILCVAGHLNSGVALAALPTYKGANLVMVSPANTNPRITDEFGGTAYRVVGRDDVQGVVAENFARDTLQVKSVYILHDKTDYGQGIAEFFRDEAEKDGITVAGFEGTEEKAVFDSIITPILAAQPDLVFWGGIYSEGGPLLKQMREKGIEAQFMGPDGIDSDQFAALAGESAVGVKYSTVAGPPSEYPAAAQFAQDYQAKFNASAPSFSPQAYDAAAICMVAIAKAAQEANGKPTREQVSAAMQDLGTFAGATGNVTFDEKGDRAPATYFIGEVGSADPAEWGNNKIISKLDIAPPGE